MVSLIIKFIKVISLTFFFFCKKKKFSMLRKLITPCVVESQIVSIKLYNLSHKFDKLHACHFGKYSDFLELKSQTKKKLEFNFFLEKTHNVKISTLKTKKKRKI